MNGDERRKKLCIKNLSGGGHCDKIVFTFFRKGGKKLAGDLIE